MQALGEAGDRRAVRHLIARLGDPSPPVSLATVRALIRLDDPAAVMPLYELAQNETATPAARKTAAEALVTYGLLRREPQRPSRIFMWLGSMALLLVGLAAVQEVGAAAIAVVALGAAALAGYYIVASRSDEERSYVKPDGRPLDIPLGAGGPTQ